MTNEEFGHLAARFPPVEAAQPDGLLAYGGCLEPAFLLAAYSRGIFPWYEEGMPILWHSPDPRAIMPLNSFLLPRRSARKIAHTPFKITLDADFAGVMRQCANTREETWITKDMLAAYIHLHELGYAHSVETWLDGSLAGGLYGVALGGCFCGESMFHLVPEASRAALDALVALLRQEHFCLLDIQQETPHMMQMGAVALPRAEYMRVLAHALGNPRSMLPGDICPWPGWHKKLLFNRSIHAWEPDNSNQPRILKGSG